MARRLARIAALTTFVIPSISAAIGVGSLETESALNEPLEARIPLESADLEELETLSATLASPDAFDRAGLERPFMLSRLEFEVVTEDTREPYVLIRTSEPVREPFLAFLVELNWAGGRLIREYTMLLDPPVHSPEQETAPAAADAPAPDEPTPDADAPATVSPGDPGDPEAVREVDTADEIQVQDNDTLWELADEVRPDDGVSVHQMMMALLEANPEAFSDGNVNNLRSGAILRVPEREAAEVLTAGEARQEFAAQVEAWQAGRAPEPAEPDPADEPAVAEDETPAEDDGRLEVVAAGETAGDDATASLMDDDLEASPETVARLQSELAAMREEEASLRSENEELRQQTAELMERVEALERTLDVQVEGALPGMTDEPVEDDIPLADAPETATDPEEEAAAVADEELPALFDEDSALAQDLAALDEEPAVEAVDPADEPAVEDDPAADVAVEDEEPAPVAADEPAAPQAPWEDTRLLSMAGGAAALIALLVLLMIRRRRNAAEDASGMVAASAGAGVAAADADEAYLQQDLEADGDGVQETAGRDGVDPLEEIEVYLAYGRYDQAGDLLASAIGNEPDRTDLRLKQLEVHALTHDRAAFEADAQDLYGMVDGVDDPVWQQVQEMGREIAPENPLFAAAAAPSSLASADEPDDVPEPVQPVEPAAETPEPLDEPSTPEEEKAGPVAPTTEADGTDEDDFGDLDFSLDDVDEDSGAEAPAEKAAGAAAAPAEDEDAFSLDFDLDDFQAPADGGKPVAEPAGERGQPADQPEGEDELSLDFEAWERPEGEQPKGGDAQSPASPETGEDDDDPPSFDLDDLDVGDDPVAEEEGLRYDGPNGADDDQGTDESLSAADDGEDSDDDGAAGAAFAAGDGDDDDDLFDAGDENSTKLDLARAYLDMGDSEGARSLLDEVIAEGSDEQKQEARSLYEEA